LILTFDHSPVKANFSDIYEVIDQIVEFPFAVFIHGTIVDPCGMKNVQNGISPL
jgi:hypothetical protein